MVGPRCSGSHKIGRRETSLTIQYACVNSYKNKSQETQEPVQAKGQVLSCGLLGTFGGHWAGATDTKRYEELAHDNVSAMPILA